MTPMPSTEPVDLPLDSTVRRDVPSLVFRVVVGLLVVFLLTGPGGARHLLSPWVHDATATHFELHRWHATDLTALVNLLAVGTLVACALAPRRHVVAGQAFLATVTSLGVLSLTMPSPAPALVPAVALAIVFVAAYPRRRELARWQGRGGHVRTAVLGAAVGTPFLVLNAWENLARQLADLGEHAALGHWAGAAALAVALLLVGWIAASGAPGSRALAVVLAVTWLYLGVAALVLRTHDGSWGLPGAVVALVTAGLFLSVPFATPRRSS